MNPEVRALNSMNETPEGASDEGTGEPRKSKSQVKRDFLALQALARALCELSAVEFAKVQLPEHIRDKATHARRLSRAAYNREIRYLAKLLSVEGEASAREAVDSVRLKNDTASAQFHELESWRDKLVAGDKTVTEDLAARFAAADIQHIRQLARNANREAFRGKPAKSSRLLFRYLAQLRDG
jgi:ribosome-associated protein